MDKSCSIRCKIKKNQKNIYNNEKIKPIKEKCWWLLILEPMS